MPTIFFQDNFTGTSGDNLISAHTPDLGAGWTARTGTGTSQPLITDANRVRGVGSFAGGSGAVANVTPPSPDYAVEGTFRIMGTQQTNGAVTIRDDGNNNLMVAEYANVAGGEIRLASIFAGTTTDRVTTPYTTLTAGTDVTLRIEANDQTYTLFKDGVLVGSWTDGSSTLTAAGKPGLRFIAPVGALSNTVGHHFDTFRAETLTYPVVAMPTFQGAY